MELEDLKLDFIVMSKHVFKRNAKENDSYLKELFSNKIFGNVYLLLKTNEIVYDLTMRTF